METPTLFDITQSILAILVVIGTAVMVVVEALPVDPFVALVATVLGFYFGRQSGESVKALSMALWRLDPENPPSPLIPEPYTERSFGGITVANEPDPIPPERQKTY